MKALYANWLGKRLQRIRAAEIKAGYELQQAEAALRELLVFKNYRRWDKTIDKAALQEEIIVAIQDYLEAAGKMLPLSISGDRLAVKLMKACQ